MLATASLPHDAISQKRTKTRPSDAGLSAVPTVQSWRATEAERYNVEISKRKSILSSPNYSKYNVSELYDALSQINADKWPERVKEIHKYLKLHELYPIEHADFSLKDKSKSFCSKLCQKCKWLPDYNTQYEILMTKAAALAILRSNTTIRGIFGVIPSGKKKFEGIVEETSFKIEPLERFKRSLRVIIRGSIIESVQQETCLVSINVRYNCINEFIHHVYYGFLFTVFIMILCFDWTGFKFFMSIIVLILNMIGGWLDKHLFFHYRAKKSLDTLKELLPVKEESAL